MRFTHRATVLAVALLALTWSTYGASMKATKAKKNFNEVRKGLLQTLALKHKAAGLNFNPASVKLFPGNACECSVPVPCGKGFKCACDLNKGPVCLGPYIKVKALQDLFNPAVPLPASPKQPVVVPKPPTVAPKKPTIAPKPQPAAAPANVQPRPFDLAAAAHFQLYIAAGCHAGGTPSAAGLAILGSNQRLRGLPAPSQCAELSGKHCDRPGVQCGPEEVVFFNTEQLPAKVPVARGDYKTGRISVFPSELSSIDPKAMSDFRTFLQSGCWPTNLDLVPRPDSITLPEVQDISKWCSELRAEMCSNPAVECQNVKLVLLDMKQLKSGKTVGVAQAVFQTGIVSTIKTTGPGPMIHLDAAADFYGYTRNGCFRAQEALKPAIWSEDWWNFICYDLKRRHCNTGRGTVCSVNDVLFNGLQNLESQKVPAARADYQTGQLFVLPPTGQPMPDAPSFDSVSVAAFGRYLYNTCVPNAVFTSAPKNVKNLGAICKTMRDLHCAAPGVECNDVGAVWYDLKQLAAGKKVPVVRGTYKTGEVEILSA